MRKTKSKILYICALMVTICLCVCQMSFVDVKAADDASYTNKTIYAKDNQGNVIGSITGMFTKGTKLVMENGTSNLDREGGRNYFELRDFTSNKNIPYYDVFSYGVKVTNGSYKGKLLITFNLGNSVTDYKTGKKAGNKYNGMNATIIAFNHPNGRDSFNNDNYIAPVDNGNVIVTIDYPSLSDEMMFMVGIPLVNDPTQIHQSKQPSKEQQVQTKKPQISEKKQPSYQNMSLEASIKNEKVNIKGSFTNGTKANISEIQKDSDIYKKLVASMPDNKIIGAYDVKVTKGSYKGMLDVSFTVNKSYAGKQVTMKHLQNDGNIESSTAKVTSDNTVQMTVSNLSPFMIFGEDNTASGLNTKQYIEIGGGIIVIIGCTIALVKSKKRKF